MDRKRLFHKLPWDGLAVCWDGQDERFFNEGDTPDTPEDWTLISKGYPANSIQHEFLTLDELAQRVFPSPRGTPYDPAPRGLSQRLDLIHKRTGKTLHQLAERALELAAIYVKWAGRKPPESLYFYGSYATGSPSQESDIDFAVIGDYGTTKDNIRYWVGPSRYYEIIGWLDDGRDISYEDASKGIGEIGGPGELDVAYLSTTPKDAIELWNRIDGWLEIPESEAT